MNESIRRTENTSAEGNALIDEHVEDQRSNRRMIGATPTTMVRSQRGSVRLTMPMVIAIVAGVVAIVMGVIAITGSGHDENADAGPASDSAPVDPGPDGERAAEQNQPSQQEQLAALARLDADDPVARGPVDAPVVMINYSDFQCQYCKKFVIDTEPELIARYVDTGLMRIEWRDFPWIGDESTAAARAARAAAEQGRFWDYNLALYADQPSKTNSGAWSDGRLQELAAELGLDVDRFRDDMNDARTAEAVSVDFAEGQGIGVTATPSFLINGRPLVGAYPLEVFVEVIDEALEAVGMTR